MVTPATTQVNRTALSGDEECARLSERKEPLEIQIGAVHDIKRTRLGDQKVENVDVVDIPLGDVDEARDRAAQIQQSVKLDRRLGGTKWCPWKHRQAQVDGRRIQPKKTALPRPRARRPTASRPAACASS